MGLPHWDKSKLTDVYKIRKKKWCSKKGTNILNLQQLLESKQIKQKGLNKSAIKGGAEILFFTQGLKVAVML